MEIRIMEKTEEKQITSSEYFRQFVKNYDAFEKNYWELYYNDKNDKLDELKKTFMDRYIKVAFKEIVENYNNLKTEEGKEAFSSIAIAQLSSLDRAYKESKTSKYYTFNIECWEFSNFTKGLIMAINEGREFEEITKSGDLGDYLERSGERGMRLWYEKLFHIYECEQDNALIKETKNKR
jgi:hypothetical protein